MNNKPFEYNNHLIALFYRGSRAYGLNTPESDSDIGAIVIPPREFFIGISKNFEQTENIEDIIEHYGDKIDMRNGVEGVIWGIEKFVKLTVDNNPNMIELLYLDESDFIDIRPEFEKLIEIRNLFLSKKVMFTFSGYSHSQLARVRLHKKWLEHPVLEPPTREKFNLPEIPTSQFKEAKALIGKEIDKWAFHEFDLSEGLQFEIKKKINDQLIFSLAALNINIGIDIDDQDLLKKAAMKKIGFDDNLMDLISRESKYRQELDYFHQYQNWKKTRNPKRAILEKKYGYDSKFVMQAIRLMRCGEEALKTGHIKVKRDDREELLAIRNGAWTYDQVIEYSEKMEVKLKELYITSPLRKTPDINKIQEVYINIIENYIFKRNVI